jgi:hypothetical protein
MLRKLTVIAGCLLGAVLVCACVFESQRINAAQEPPGGEIVLKSESALVVLDVVVPANVSERALVGLNYLPEPRILVVRTAFN